MKSCLRTVHNCRWPPQWRCAIIQRASISSVVSKQSPAQAELSVEHKNGLQIGVRTREKLPLPPIMDPKVLSAREKYRIPKARPKQDELSEFQKKLHASPYAHALASPMRQCSFANARLPSEFLISFRSIKNPSTKKPWFLPVDLLPKSNKPKRIGPSNYFLNRDNLMRFLVHSRKKPTDSYLEPNLRRHVGSENEKVVWREDMPNYVLVLMRQQATRRLRWLLTHQDNSRIVLLSTPYPVLHPLVDEISCVIQLQSSYSHEVRELSMKVEQSAEEIALQIVPQIFKIYHYARGKAKSSHRDPPPYPLVPAPPDAVLSKRLEFSTLRVRRDKSRVALFKLWELLGGQAVKALVEGTKAEEEGARWLVIKRDARNLGLEKALNQLQGYLADRKL